MELKATTAQEIVRNENDCDYMDEMFGGVKMPPTQVYLKSEADEYIEDMKAHFLHEIEIRDKHVESVEGDYKEALGRLQTANLIAEEQRSLVAKKNQEIDDLKSQIETLERRVYRANRDARRTRY